jgi:hypothetical protein
MKKIFTLLASLFLAVAVFAAARPKSTLMIQSVDRASVKVVIDGRRFEPNDNFVRIQGLEAGSHRVKIYRERNNGMFTIFGKRYEVVFNSTVSIQPRSNTMISIDRFGRATVQSNRTMGYGNGRNDRDWSRNSDFEFERGSRSGDYDNDRGGKWGDYDNNYGYNGMTNQEFDRVLQQIEKEWLESNKLKSASHIATTNNLTSAQVRELVSLFAMESNKLSIAKEAYANTIDKRNYSIVSDAFNFNSSKDELARFIRNFR